MVRRPAADADLGRAGQSRHTLRTLAVAIGRPAKACTHKRGRWRNVRFSNRPVGVKHFQTIRRCGVDVTHGLVLLFGIGTRALPSWDSKTRWSNLRVGLAGRRTAGPSGHANSPHPSSREGHHSTAGWSSTFLLSRLILRGSSRCRSLPGPAELGTINPDAVHDHGQPAGQSHDRLFHPATPGDLHCPSLKPGPFL